MLACFMLFRESCRFLPKAHLSVALLRIFAHLPRATVEEVFP